METIGENTPYQVGSADNPARNLLEEVASKLRDISGEIERGASAERTWGFAERLKALATALENVETTR